MSCCVKLDSSRPPLRLMRFHQLHVDMRFVLLVLLLIFCLATRRFRGTQHVCAPESLDLTAPSPTTCYAIHVV
jgi:hypothetical protein